MGKKNTQSMVLRKPESHMLKKTLDHDLTRLIKMYLKWIKDKRND